MISKNSELAFPANTAYYSSPGMTLRDWFAGMLLNSSLLPVESKTDIAKICYQVADEMLKARKASQNE